MNHRAARVFLRQPVRRTVTKPGACRQRVSPRLVQPVPAFALPGLYRRSGRQRRRAEGPGVV